jgi:hypothetical protein
MAEEIAYSQEGGRHQDYDPIGWVSLVSSPIIYCCIDLGVTPNHLQLI